MKYLILIIFTIFLACHEQNNINSEKLTVLTNKDSIKSFFKPSEKRVFSGDFNGDGKTDSLFVNAINKLTGLSIDSFPDPFKNEWDSVVDFFYKNNSSLVLTTSNKTIDTLYLGCGIDLYCLINIGDNNKDGKNEIAIVVDWFDYSRVNSCFIYSICSNKWVLLKRFSIHEDAFDYLFGEEERPIFKQINGFLEKKNNKWKFLDYMEDLAFEKEEGVGKMKDLRLDSCK